MYSIYTIAHAEQEQSNDQEINYANRQRQRPADPFVDRPGYGQRSSSCVFEMYPMRPSELEHK